MGFLNAGFKALGVIKTICQVYDDNNERQLWELYIHFKPPKKSFNDFKFSAGFYSAPKSTAGGTKNEAETKAIVNHSESILRGFKP